MIPGHEERERKFIHKEKADPSGSALLVFSESLRLLRYFFVVTYFFADHFE